MITNIFLIRHSSSLKLDSKLYKVKEKAQITNEKLPLSIDGEKKAEKLLKIPELNQIDMVYSSSYVRAISTAKYIAEKNSLLINVDERFNERMLGNTRGVPKTFWITQLEDENAKTEGGENRLEVTNRMNEAINEILKNNNGKNIAIVSHATAITFFLMNFCKLEDVELENKKRHFTFNNKTVINRGFNTPEVFKITYKNDRVIEVSIIEIGEED